MGKYDDRPYEVGKGKPPRSHRWKKGQSGNPRGPKRRATRDNATMSEILSEIMNEKTEVTIRGKSRLLPIREVLLLKLVHDAGSGTPAQRLRNFKELAALGAFSTVVSDERDDPESQAARINAVLDELAKEAERDSLLDAEFGPFN